MGVVHRRRANGSRASRGASLSSRAFRRAVSDACALPVLARRAACSWRRVRRRVHESAPPRSPSQAARRVRGAGGAGEACSVDACKERRALMVLLPRLNGVSVIARVAPAPMPFRLRPGRARNGHEKSRCVRRSAATGDHWGVRRVEAPRDGSRGSGFGKTPGSSRSTRRDDAAEVTGHELHGVQSTLPVCVALNVLDAEHPPSSVGSR